MHISELAQHHVENPREVVSQGDLVNVKIIEVDAERRRLSLSLKRVEDGEDAAAAGRGRRAAPPQIDLSEEVFADALPRAGRGGRRARGRGGRGGAPSARRPPTQPRRRPREPEAEEPRRRRGVGEPVGRARRRRRLGRGRRDSAGPGRPALLVPARGPLARRRHRRHRRGQERGAGGVRAPRRGDALRRPRRPPPDRRRPGGACSAARSASERPTGPESPLVFADREQLDWLEALLHPRVRRDQGAWLAGLDAPVAATSPAPLRDRRRGALRRGRRDHRARRARAERRGPAGDRAQPGCSPTPRRSGVPTSPTSTTARSTSSTRSSGRCSTA